MIELEQEGLRVGALERGVAQVLEAHADPRSLATLRPHALSFDVRGLPTPATVRWREEGGLLTMWTVRDEATLATARAHADGMIFEGVTP